MQTERTDENIVAAAAEEKGRGEKWKRWPTASESLSALEAFLDGHGLLQAAHDSYDVFARRQIRAIILEKPETAAENDLRTRRASFTVDHVSIAKPTFCEPDGEERLIYPAEARIRKLTYAATVRIGFTYVEEDRPAGPPTAAGALPARAVTYSLVQKDVPFVSVPVMVRSAFCNTRDAAAAGSGSGSGDGECPLDGGGYFVINGTEKAIIMQEDVRTNTPYVRALPPGGRFSHVCEIRSLDESKLRSTSTLYIYVTAPRGGRPPSVEVALPFLETNLPMAIVFRLLDVGTRAEMEALILGAGGSNAAATAATAATADGPHPASSPSSPSSSSLLRVIRAALESDARTEAYSAPTKEDVSASVERGRGPAAVRARRITHTVANEFLPHIGTAADARRKAVVFGHAVRRLLLVYVGETPPDDRDDYGAKRIKLPGVLLALLFRQLYRSHQQSLQMALRRALDAPRRPPPASYIAFRRLSAALASPLATGSWTVAASSSSSSAKGGGGGSSSSSSAAAAGGGGGAQTGVAHVLTRMAQVGTLSHLRRVNTRISREGKRPEPRQLNHGHWAVFCPAETPEGESCGLMQNLALLCRVRVGESSGVIRAFVRSGAPGFVPLLSSPLSSSSPSSPGTGEGGGGGVPAAAAAATMVFVNGVPLGTTTDPAGLMEGFRARRRSGDFPRDASCCWRKAAAEITFSTDKGCPVRPVFDLARVGTPAAAAAFALSSPAARWTALLDSGAIVYMDKDEETSEGVLIATDATAQPAAYPGRPYTHCEISPVGILGLCANSVPFPDHNQSPRNVYSGAMMKQRMGHAVSNAHRRMDSLAFKLSYVQRPLVQTAPAALMRFDRLPGEQNPIVAVATYTDYNGEDAVILNKASVDRGLFRGEVLRTYRDEEHGRTGSAESGEVYGPRFAPVDPDDPRIVGTRGNRDTYAAVMSAGDGLPRAGDVIPNGGAVIGKLVPLVAGDAAATEGRFKDVSTFVRSKAPACVVRVARTTDRGDRTAVSVQTREQRIPGVGDKFASRHGQKGVVGIVLAPEDMPFCEASGVIPDMIVNPHGFPSRMTFGQHLEGILGKAVCAAGGVVGDGTAFSPVSSSSPHDDEAGATGGRERGGEGEGEGRRCGSGSGIVTAAEAAAILRARGYNPSGKERMVNGMTGEVMAAEIFICPVQYQRLKHMVDDKVHARARGPLSLLTRQPTEGRFKDGGLRFGEMEVNSLNSYGVPAVLRDRIFEQSDAYTLPVCTRCGLFAQDIVAAAEDDAPGASRKRKRKRQGRGADEEEGFLWCRGCSVGAPVVRRDRIPYATKLLFQEMTALHMTPRIKY